MPVIELPFGEWLPSAPKYNNPGCLVADNVIPRPGGGYGPFPAMVETDDTVTGQSYGAAQYISGAGARVIVGGAGTRLFVIQSSVSETSGLTEPAQFWDFARFNDFVIATDINNAPQYLTNLASDTTWSDLTGSPPNARYCAKVNEFLMLGNIENQPYRIQWSAFNNPAGAWAAARLTQAGSADLATELGVVQRIVGGRFGLVFQENGIQRLSYVGPPVVWRTDILSRERGTIAPFSVVQLGDRVFFLARDGFWATDGAGFQPIGTSRVNRWFFDNVDQSLLSRVHGAVDWQNECIIWAFPQQVENGFDRFIIYSWAQDRWSTATASVGCILSARLAGSTLEDLDGGTDGIDGLPYSLDSDAYKAIDTKLSAFGTGATPALGHFYGDPLRASFETSEFQPAKGRRVFVSEVTPIVEISPGNSLDVVAGLVVRDNQGVPTSRNLVECGWSGFAAVRGEGSKMRIVAQKPAGGLWTDWQGVQMRFRPTGQR